MGCARWWAHRTISANRDHIDRAILSTDVCLVRHGVQQGKIPHQMRLHSH
jgi:NTE family protein